MYTPFIFTMPNQNTLLLNILEGFKIYYKSKPIQATIGFRVGWYLGHCTTQLTLELHVCNAQFWKQLVPVVQRVDNVIRQIKCSPTNTIYLLDKLTCIHSLNNWAQDSKIVVPVKLDILFICPWSLTINLLSELNSTKPCYSLFFQSSTKAVFQK